MSQPTNFKLKSKLELTEKCWETEISKIAKMAILSFYAYPKHQSPISAINIEFSIVEI